MGLWNFIETIGAFVIAVSVLLFIYGMVWSLRHGHEAGNDPWDARTLEWSIPSPPPHYNFEHIPLVHAVDDWWHQKYGPHRDTAPTGEPPQEHPLMPDPSYFPPLAGVGMFLLPLGFLLTTSNMVLAAAIMAVGLAILLAALYGWSFEPVRSPRLEELAGRPEGEEPGVVREPVEPGVRLPAGSGGGR